MKLPRSLSTAAFFVALFSLTAGPLLAQSRTQSRVNRRTQVRGDANETRTDVTAEQESAIFHSMLALSVLEGSKIGPVIGGGSGVVVCDDCGDWPGDPETCSDLRQKVHDAAKANLDAQKVLDQFQALLQAYYEWQFWGGAGSMVVDMVAAATTVATAGTGTGAVLAAAEVLAEMGADATVGAMQDAVADAFGIDLSGETAMADAVAAFNEARKETNRAYREALEAWLACRGRREEALAEIDAWNACWATRQCWVEY
jgi:hypothetical protein